MAPRSKSARQSKARSVSNAPLSTTTQVDPVVPMVIEDGNPEAAASPPQTPISAGRTYAQAVRSAPPSPRQESASTISAPAAIFVAPATSQTDNNADVGQDSLGDTSILVRVQALPYLLQN